MALKAETITLEENTDVSEIEGTRSEIDLIVPAGLTLTATDESTEEVSSYFNSVTIAAGAVLDIPEDTYLNTKMLVLEGGAEDNGSYQFTFPKVRAVGGINIYGGDDAQVIYYDYLLNNAQWYALCLPVNVATSEISFLDERTAQYAENYLLQEYDSDARAEGRTGWKDLESDPITIQAGKGYNIFIDGSQLTRVRFPLHYNLRGGEAMDDEGVYTEKSISLSAKTASEASNQGWNLIGNPFLMDYTGFLAIDQDWSNYLEYATFPNWNGTKYTHTEVDYETIPPFHTFFVQVEQACTLSFAYDYCIGDDEPGFFAPLRAPKPRQKDMHRYGLTLTGNNQDDRVGIRFSDKYTTDYDFNGDLSKWMNKDLNVYALLGNEKVAFLANPESVLTNIFIGYKATSAGEYTFALDTRHDYSKIQSILLTDAEEGVTTDLKIGSYSFQTNKGTFDARFSVSVVIANAPTGIDGTKATGGTQKMLLNGEFVIYKNNQLFNAQGAQIQ